MILSQNENIMKAMADWQVGDMIFMRGTIATADHQKKIRCPYCGNTEILPTQITYVNPVYGDFGNWNPYFGMEVAMTRQRTEKTRTPDYTRTAAVLPPVDEKMGVEEMLLGYTINGAKQLGIEDHKGSITVGKDADFLVFDNDLLTAEHEGFSQNKPRDVYFCGKRI